MQKIITVLLLLICLPFLNACKKVDESKLPSPGTREMLTSKDWLLISKSNTSFEDNDCSNDLKWRFLNSGTFLQVKHCDNAIDLSLTWTLTNNTVLLDNLEFTISSITPTSLVMTDGSETYTFKPF